MLKHTRFKPKLVPKLVIARLSIRASTCFLISVCAGIVLSKYCVLPQAAFIASLSFIISFFVRPLKKNGKSLAFSFFCLGTICCSYLYTSDFYVSLLDEKTVRQQQLIRIKVRVTSTWLELLNAQDVLAGKIADAKTVSHDAWRQKYYSFEAEILVDDSKPDSTDWLLLDRAKVRVLLPAPVQQIHKNDVISGLAWLKLFESAQNPGEFDPKAWARRTGLLATIVFAEDYRLQSTDMRAVDIGKWKMYLQQRAESALLLGLASKTETAHFLSRLLLGRRHGNSQDTELFRELGISHYLAVSGAHLSMLAVIVLFSLRFLFLHPRIVVSLLLLWLLLYSMVIPERTPILRASIMIGMYLIGHVLERRSFGILHVFENWHGDMLQARDGYRASMYYGLFLLELTVLVLLIKNPLNLFDCGFQLSAGVVFALILFARIRPVGDAMKRSAIFDLRRWIYQLVIASYVATSLASLILAWHLNKFSPGAAIASLIYYPIFCLYMALGFLKLLTGIFVPSLSLLLAPVCVEIYHISMSTLSNLAVLLDHIFLEIVGERQGLLYSLSLLLVLLSLWRWRLFDRLYIGLNRYRVHFWRLTFWVSLHVFIGMSLSLLGVGRSDWETDPPGQVVLKWQMLSVGDGSCHIFHLYGSDQHEPRVVMFDAGSRTIPSVGERIVVPFLEEIGIRKIDAFYISHDDYDHYSAINVMKDKVRIDAIYISEYMQQDHIQALLGTSKIDIRTLTEDDCQKYGDWQFSVLAPPKPAGLVPSKGRTLSDNDLSLNLFVSLVEGHAIADHAKKQPGFLLTGDANLLSRDLSDYFVISEMPHHGAFDRRTYQWVYQVEPCYLMQSCDRRRLEDDRWQLYKDLPPRYMTAREGMVELALTRDNTLWKRSFHRPEWQKVDK